MPYITKRSRLFAVTTAAVILGLTVLVITHRTHSGNASPTRLTADEANDAEHVDFNEPLIHGRRLASVQSAAETVAFPVVSPAQMGSPVSAWVPADRPPTLLALIYQHPTFGRFMAIEQPNQGTVRDLKRLVSQCASGGCQERWVLSRLADDSPAVLALGSPAAPHDVTSVFWMHGGVAFNVVGPAATFTRADAVDVANAFEAAA